MNQTAEQYDLAARPLAALLDAVPGPSWSAPSPCEGWSALDVVQHLVDTQRTLLTGHGLGLGPAPDAAVGPAVAFHQHAARVAAVLADDTVPAIGFDGYFGPTTLGATLEQFYVWDMLVHRWDIASAVGLRADWSDDELDRIEAGAESFGDALYLDGVCKPLADATAAEDRRGAALARLGRTEQGAVRVSGR